MSRLSPDSRSLVEANRADFRRILNMYLKRIEDPVDLRDEDSIPVNIMISGKVLHLRQLGISFASIAERLEFNLWMVKRAARWGKIHHKG